MSFIFGLPPGLDIPGLFFILQITCFYACQINIRVLSCRFIKKLSVMKQVTAKSYTLHGEKGEWLGQIVLTSDGMFASVTDYGNLSYAWRSYGMDADFRKFLCGLNAGYFATKLFSGMSYILHTKKCEKACELFAEKILPVLQKALKEELEKELMVS